MLRAPCSMRLGPLAMLSVALCSILVLLLFPSAANAQGIFQGFSGLLEFNYSLISSKTTDALGNTTKITTNTYNPRVTLSVNTNLFPKLNLNAGGVFEKNISLSSGEQENTRTTLTRFRPYVYLTLTDPLYEASIGYNRREDTTKVTDTPHFTLISDDYLAILKWRPVGFPSIETQFERTNTYDERKEVQNTTRDYISLLSRYNYEGLDVRYQGSYIDTNDKFNNVDTKDMIHSAWLSYSNSFFNRRVLLSTTYNINYEEVKTTTQGTGTVGVQLFPLAGLSLNDDTVNPITLGSNPALIDGNLGVSAGINIGLPPLAGDNRERQMGLDFFVATEVNQLFLWFDRDLSTATDVVNFFSSNALGIRVYQSPDNLNWTQVAPVSVSLGQFQNRFEINFPGVTARFLKVVTKPLQPFVPVASSFPDIFVTELQAFLNKPVPGRKSRTTRTSQNYYFDSKTRILDIPLLFYELGYYYTRIDPNGQLRYTVSNGFSVNHRFSQVFSGRARVARENGEEQKEHRTAWIYDASIEAIPLKTLVNRLVFSGRDETIGGKRNNNNSIILYNIAELYKGIEMNLNVGQNFSKDESGLRTDETDVQILATVIPSRTLNMTLDYKYSIIDQSGGENPIGSANRHTGEFILSYNPFRTLFVVATIDVSAQTGQKTSVTQNYGFNWSPFPDGALQFRFFYNENLATTGIKERIINPGVRWYLTRRSYLDFSYQRNVNKSASQKTDENFFNAQLKIFL
jgi:hypothetical protein